MARWPTGRRTRDMFGRTIGAAAAGPGPTAGAPLGASGQSAAAQGPRPVPRWMVPWLLPAFVVFVIIVIGLAPTLVAILLILMVLAAIGVSLSRANRGMTYEEIRQTDPLHRAFDDFRRGRGYLGLDSDGPAR